MAQPSETLVREVLGRGNRAALIRSAVTGGWTDVMEKYPDRAWWRRKTTRAGLMWEHSVQNAIDALSGDDGFKAVPHDDTVSFVFDQSVLVRFKKADMELRTSNVVTGLSSLFHRHETELPLFEDLQRVEAAYVLNQFQTKIDWTGIVARDRKRLLWQFELEGGGTVETLPLTDARKETAAERVMHLKGVANDADRENTETE